MSDDFDHMQTMRRSGQPSGGTGEDDLDSQMTMRPPISPSLRGDDFDGAVTMRPQAPSSFPDEREMDDVKIGELRRGDVLDGKYQVIKKLGQGGMGAVYKVIDDTTDVEYAVKVVLPEYIEDPAALKELRSELAKAQSFTHQNLLNYKFFADTGAVKYIVMELVDGEDLEEYRLKKGGRLQEAEAKRIAVQILNGLNYFHDKGLVHLDLKPQNIMISKSGEVKITDYGISKSIKEQIESGAQDAEMAAGTLCFMAPEQLNGSLCDRRTDIYALGLIFYQLLQGEFPFSLKSKEAIVTWHLDAKHICQATGSSVFDQVIAKAISVDPNQRFTHCTEIVELLTKTSATPSTDGTASASVESLMERGYLFLEDSDWVQANQYFDRVLDIAPKHAPAYVGKLCVELKVQDEEQLGDWEKSLSEYSNFQKAARFADTEYQKKIEGYEQKIRDHILQKHYDQLVQATEKASTELVYRSLAEQFRAMDGYKDTAELANECDKRIAHLQEIGRAEQERREELERQEQERIQQEQERKQKEQYLRLGEDLKTATTEEDWQKLADQFRKMSGYKNTAELASQCENRAIRRRYARLCKEAELTFRKEDSTEADWRKLAKQLRAMNGYKNTAELAGKCENKTRVLKEQREAEERERRKAVEDVMAEVDIEGYKSSFRNIFEAAEKGSVRDVAYYIKQRGGSDRVNVKDEKGRTPLHIAAESQQGDSVQRVLLLVEAGADVNAKDNEGKTPLGYCKSPFRLVGEYFIVLGFFLLILWVLLWVLCWIFDWSFWGVFGITSVLVAVALVGVGVLAHQEYQKKRSILCNADDYRALKARREEQKLPTETEAVKEVAERWRKNGRVSALLLIALFVLMYVMFGIWAGEGGANLDFEDGIVLWITGLIFLLAPFLAMFFTSSNRQFVRTFLLFAGLLFSLILALICVIEADGNGFLVGLMLAVLTISNLASYVVAFAFPKD